MQLKLYSTKRTNQLSLKLGCPFLKGYRSLQNYRLAGRSLMAQWLGFCGFTAVMWIQSLVWELRYHKPHGATNRIKDYRLAEVIIGNLRICGQLLMFLNQQAMYHLKPFPTLPTARKDGYIIFPQFHIRHVNNQELTLK